MMKWKGIWQLPQSKTVGSGPVPVLRYGITLLALTAVYFCTGHFGQLLGAFSGFATLIWLPSGIAVASLFLWGFRLWPAITLGTFLVDLFAGASPLVAIGTSIGCTLEALVCTALLKHKRVSPALDSLHDILVLVLIAAPISTFISAVIGVSSLLLGGSMVWSSVYETWSAWWLGDLISLLQLTPLLLTWSTWPQVTLSFKRLIELSLLSVFMLVVGVFVFLGLPHLNQQGDPITYLVFPPLTWAALRFGPRGATAAFTAFSGFAIVGTVLGLSPFSAGSLGERLFYLQGFMAITAVTALILAAMMAERCALEQRKDEFISIASHELRTPLTCLQGYTQLLQRQLAGSDQPRALHALAIMEKQIRHLSRLIADLLDLSKIQVGKLTFIEETVDMNTLVREVAEQLQQTSIQHQINIEGNTSGTIVGDREHLGQVLNNLISNAIKYSPGAERIIIRLTSTTKHLTVSVQDFGIGIPATEQEKVFERFYRVAGKYRQTTAGLGIGLSIAHQIIEHYEGKLWIESVEGQGSTFSFSLPRR
ncbi:MAG TPA: MASE1 domain-containing protein [Ktedonobacteraceae bacterium]